MWMRDSIHDEFRPDARNLCYANRGILVKLDGVGDECGDDLLLEARRSPENR